MLTIIGPVENGIHGVERNIIFALIFVIPKKCSFGGLALWSCRLLGIMEGRYFVK